MAVDTALKAVQAAISDPMLTRNYRGQLTAALRVLEPDDRMILACDYAEHVAWIYENILLGDERVRAAILVVRNSLKEAASIHDIAEARSKIWSQFSELRNSPIEGAMIAREVGVAAVWAIMVCCQRQLEAAHYVVHEKRQVETDAVAYQASYVTALYAAGRDWDSKDKLVRSAARKRGYAASEKETQWQIQRLLDYLSEKSRSDESSEADDGG